MMMVTVSPIWDGQSCGSDPLESGSVSYRRRWSLYVDQDDDDDGFTDEEEAARGADPLDALSFPEEDAGGLNMILIKAAIDATRSVQR